MVVYHFSEDPSIGRFEPLVSASAKDSEPLVWAIDAWHVPLYLFPRDCPRACFWADARTTPEDRARFLAFARSKMVIAIEFGWLGALQRTRLYRYVLPASTFTSHDATAGYHVSRQAVVPLSVDPVGDLLAALAGADVELRLTTTLGPLWQHVSASTLQFSGIRLRNARDREHWVSPRAPW